MEWQDALLGGGSIVFGLALIPSLVGDQKPNFWTGLITSTLLYSYVIAFVTLDLWFAAMTDAFSATVWLLLTVQAWRLAREE